MTITYLTQPHFLAVVFLRWLGPCHSRTKLYQTIASRPSMLYAGRWGKTDHVGYLSQPRENDGKGWT